MSNKRISLLAAALLAPAVLSAAPVTMTVLPSLGPNALASSWNAYVAKAINAIEMGLTSDGDPNTDPTSYFQVTTLNELDNVATSFASWRGIAGPGAPFDLELGNQLYFGLHIVGNGTKFSLAGLSYTQNSTDADGVFGAFGDYFSAQYSAERVGIDYGADGIKGTLDDIIYTSGDSNQAIDELMLVGISTAIGPNQIAGCAGSGQSAIDCVTAYYIDNSILSILGQYTLVNDSFSVLGSSSGSVDIVAGPQASDTPEPATFAMGLAGCVALLTLRRRAA